MIQLQPYMGKCQNARMHTCMLDPHAHTHALTVARSTSPSREVKSSCRLVALPLARRSVTCWENREVQARCVRIETTDKGKDANTDNITTCRGAKEACKMLTCILFLLI